MGITCDSVHGSAMTEHQSSRLTMGMAHYTSSAQRSHPHPISTFTRFDSLLAELRSRSRFRSSLFSISPEKIYIDFTAYIRCRSPGQSN